MAIEDNRVVLFDGQLVDGSSAEEVVRFKGSKCIMAWGNFGGGQIQLEVESPSNSQWIPVEGGLFTQPEARTLDDFPQGLKFRGVLSGSTGANVILEIAK